MTWKLTYGRTDIEREFPTLEAAEAYRAALIDTGTPPDEIILNRVHQVGAFGGAELTSLPYSQRSKN